MFRSLGTPNSCQVFVCKTEEREREREREIFSSEKRKKENTYLSFSSCLSFDDSISLFDFSQVGFMSVSFILEDGLFECSSLFVVLKWPNTVESFEVKPSSEYNANAIHYKMWPDVDLCVGKSKVKNELDDMLQQVKEEREREREEHKATWAKRNNWDVKLHTATGQFGSRMRRRRGRRGPGRERKRKMKIALVSLRLLLWLFAGRWMYFRFLLCIRDPDLREWAAKKSNEPSTKILPQLSLRYKWPGQGLIVRLGSCCVWLWV